MTLKPLGGLTKTLRILLRITIGIAIMALALPGGIYIHDYFSPANRLLEAELNEAIQVEMVIGLFGLMKLVLAIVTVITFLRWIYRTNKNLRALSAEPMTFTPGWSVGLYFVPFANLFKPYQVMKEIWQVSHKNRAGSHAIVGWWWALLILSGLGHGAFNLVIADDAAGDAAFTMAFIVSYGLDVILGIVALMLVTRVGIAYSTNVVEPTGPVYGGLSPASPPPLI